MSNWRDTAIALGIQEEFEVLAAAYVDNPAVYLLNWGPFGSARWVYSEPPADTPLAAGYSLLFPFPAPGPFPYGEPVVPDH